jgi:hypothetical protein
MTTMNFQHEWLCLLQEKTSPEQAPRIVIAQGPVPGKAQPPSLGHGCARNAVILSRRQEVPEVAAALSVIDINTYGYRVLYHIIPSQINSLHFMMMDCCSVDFGFQCRKVGRHVFGDCCLRAYVHLMPASQLGLWNEWHYYC